MKFATKLSFAVTLLLAVSLSLGGYILVRQNFDDSLAAVVEQNIGQHQFERYALQAELLDNAAQSGREDDSRLMRYGATLSNYLGDTRRMISFFHEDKSEIYSNFPAKIPMVARGEALADGGRAYRLYKVDGEVYMLIATMVETPHQNLWLLSGYDISYLFDLRDKQVVSLWRVGGVVLAVGIIVTVLLAHLLTRPIRRLSRLSRRISAGAYAVRTGVKTEDEIGELSRNFDRMAAAVEERVEALEHSVQQRDDFVSAFTHEIKTPMTSIIGYSDLVRGVQYDEKTRHLASNHIFHEAKRLEALSQKLLRLMGLSAQKVVLRPVSVDSLLVAAKRALLPLPADMRVEWEPCKEVVWADRELAVDLLRNLVANALKASAAGGAVRVRAQVKGDRCYLAVCDQGCGIPADELARITEAFYMVDKSRARAQGGTGIGLALCTKIAEAHGTKLYFQSKVGQGTTVTFFFTLYKAEEEQEQGEKAVIEGPP